MALVIIGLAFVLWAKSREDSAPPEQVPTNNGTKEETAPILRINTE